MILQLSDEQKAAVKEEVSRQLSEKGTAPPFANELTGLGGFLAGSGIALGAVSPVESMLEQRNLNKALAESNLYENEKEAYRALRSIVKGQASFEDFGGAADLLKQLHNDQDIRAMIENDQAYADMMRKYRYGKIIDIRNANKDIKMNNLKRLAPYRGVIENFSEQAKSPIVSLGGLAGAVMGTALYNQMKNRNANN